MAERTDGWSISDVFSRTTQEAEFTESRPLVVAVRSDKLYRYSKRLLDILLSAIALIILSPFLALIAIAIRLDSPGPAVIVQHRVGKGGRIFDFFKFRSMYQKANDEAHREFAHEYINGNHAKLNGSSGAKPQIFKPATQVTRVGRILRKTSLDELPQLVNILKGDMSLVGPRPSIDYELEEYAPWHRRRLAVLPGLTGWAQIHGRSTLAFDEIAALDIEYIKRQSLLLDLWIILRTIPLVLLCKGAG